MAKRTHNSDELFELKWNNYSQSITEEIYNIRQNDCLVDLTFCCEGVTIGCHKLLIFACSPVLRQILTANPSPHPIIYITDIKLPILQALLKYVYQGEVQISKSDLVAFMKAADSFQIRGLQSKKSLGDAGSAVSTSIDNIKKRRTFESSAGPSTASLAGLGDPLNSSISAMHHDPHDASNLDFSEFENECTFGANDESSIDDSRFSSGTLTPTAVQQTAQKLRRFIKSSATGIEVMNEYEQHTALTDEKREDLSQLVTEFMAKGVVKGGRSGHETIAEATLVLFPGVFEDDPKTLAEALYNRLGQQTQQRYGTESPEAVASSAIGGIDILSDEDFDEFEDIHSLLTIKQEQIFSVEEIVGENDSFKIPAVMQLLPSELIKQEIDTSYYSRPSPPAFDLASQIILQPPPSSEKYLLASAKLEIADVETYVKQMRFELRYLAEKWKTDYLTGRETTTPLALKLQQSPEPQIEVDVDDAGKLYATIECVLCSKIIRIGFNKYKTLEGMKHRLNGGNFNSHLRNHFRDFQ